MSCKQIYEAFGNEACTKRKSIKRQITKDFYTVQISYSKSLRLIFSFPPLLGVLITYWTQYFTSKATPIIQYSSNTNNQVYQNLFFYLLLTLINTAEREKKNCSTNARVYDEVS